MTRRRTANWPPLPASSHAAASGAVSDALTPSPGLPVSPAASQPLTEAQERTNPNAWRNDRFDNRTGAWVPNPLAPGSNWARHNGKP